MSRNAEMVIPDDIEDDNVNAVMSDLRNLIEEHRANYYPPTLDDNLVFIDENLPIWVGSFDDVKRYHLKYKQSFDLAHKFYPQAKLFKHATLPAKLRLPQFQYHVMRLSLTKNIAKESISFGSVGAVIARCGPFDDAHITRMNEYFENHPNGRLVCHREYFDFRARMHFFNTQLKVPEKQTLITQFYTTGLIIAAHDIDNFEVIDHSNRNIREYKNAYKNPLANNGTWKVYAKKAS